MMIRRAISWGLAGLLATAGAALAAEADPCRQVTPPRLGSPQSEHAWRAATHVFDERTGTEMRLIRLGSDAVQIEIDGDNLKVSKTLQANGDFDLALRTADDLLTVTGRAARLRVSRRGHTVDLGPETLTERDLDRLQQVLAGSSAIRRFRAMRSMLTPSTRCTGPGTAVDIIDVMIGVLKGEGPSPITAMAEPMASGESDLIAEPDPAGPTCYEAWVVEVVAAWQDYEACVYSFAWYNPLREVCALAWVIRVESAWFRLIGCSSIPLKLEASDVETDLGLR
ncbi:MAG: hypothetical protein NTV05_07790 [Acidobacteria bacterium]|nr:hypothetical protein [Acidobacteriota bacterium]